MSGHALMPTISRGMVFAATQDRLKQRFSKPQIEVAIQNSPYSKNQAMTRFSASAFAYCCYGCARQAAERLTVEQSALVPLQRGALGDLAGRGCRRIELDARPAVRQIHTHFLVRGFVGLVLAPSAFTLSSGSPEPSAIGSHPGIPCRMRSAFLAGVMWP